jgi:hypothetical protein
VSKILFISNLSNRITSFVTASIEAAHSLDIEFYQAANWGNTEISQIQSDEQQYGIHIKSFPFSRNPLSKSNFKAYKELVQFIKTEKIDYIHCNTPTGGLLGRLAGRKCKVKKVIYQAHGFHFYKGAPLKNWLLYYPVEKWLARYTDALITINNEDFERAKKKFKLRNHGKVYYVPGVGIDTTQYNLDEKLREGKRRELGLNEGDIAVISMGDLIERKNYDTAIRAIAEANEPKLQYFICGKGPEEEKLKALAESLGVTKQIHFLGFRSDIKELLTAADIFLFTTKQEGLPRSMMEAMASGLPCIASKIRGNTDLLDGTDGGFLCKTTDVSDYAEKLKILASDKDLRKTMGRINLVTIHGFNSETVSKEIVKIYEQELRGVTLNEYIHTLFDFYPMFVKKRVKLGISLDAFVIISVGELNANKNNRVIISAMETLNSKKIHYILCGIGEKQIKLQMQADRAGLHDNVHFLGYRNDVKELYEAADCFVMPSFREGLSRSLMEAMASGLPCVVSKIRGNNDLITDNKGGFLCEPQNSAGFAKAIGSLCANKTLCDGMSIFNKEKIKEFDLSASEKAMRSIYTEVL